MATVKEQIAPKPKIVYFEFDTQVELVGKMENVHIAFIAKEAYRKFREAVKNNDDAIKAGGSAIWYVIAKKFDISKPLTDNENKRLKELNQKSELLMPDKEKKELKDLRARAGFRVLVSIMLPTIIILPTAKPLLRHHQLQTRCPLLLQP